MAGIVRRMLLYGIALVFLLVITTLIWLRWDSARPLQTWFESRQGELTNVVINETDAGPAQISELLTLTADSGLAVTLRAIRNPAADESLPVLLILGGHRTGSDAAKLFGNIGARAIVALDYPYHGPEKAKGIVQIAKAIPLARQAFRDTPPAVSLALDWLLQQAWVDADQVIIVGASLGVPFAALSAVRDDRIRGVLLVHGAADNQLWLEAQIARRQQLKLLHKPLATIIHWLAYGPTFDTARNIAAISPRPVLVIGARDDERTPAGQTERLFAAAGEPKWLRWTDGAHVDPGRPEILQELLKIADEMLPFPPASR